MTLYLPDCILNILIRGITRLVLSRSHVTVVSICIGALGSEALREQKCCGVLSALGNLLSQALEKRAKAKRGVPAKDIDTLGIARFAVYGVCVTGPISHYFYQLMELLVPSNTPHCMVKRLLLDRFVFAPAFLLLFFIVMNILEVNTWPTLQAKLRVSYWSALKMNWKVWTPFQFVNINFVPVQFRVLFANLVALFWYAYLASVRK